MNLEEIPDDDIRDLKWLYWRLQLLGETQDNIIDAIEGLHHRFSVIEKILNLHTSDRKVILRCLGKDEDELETLNTYLKRLSGQVVELRERLDKSSKKRGNKYI